MISEANLNAIEFGILRPQICIRDMRPPHSYIPASVRLRGQVNTSAAPYREVEVRGITSGEIPIGPHTAPGQLNVWGCVAESVGRVPSQNYWVELYSMQTTRP